MQTHYTTINEQPHRRKSYWEQVVTKTYFSLSVDFNTETQFQGHLCAWDLGPISLSRLDSDGLLYQRKDEHLRHEHEENYLVTIPDKQPIDFTQGNRDVGCEPGAFILQRSHEPYRLSYTQANRLWVLKIPAAVLGSRISFPQKLVSLAFDARAGAGELMVEMVRLLSHRLSHMDGLAKQTIGNHLVDLLVLALADVTPQQSNLSSVQAAHLARAEKYIRDHLRRAIRPHDVAAACGISVRYLHALFRARGQTVGSWLQEQRLLMANSTLQQNRDNRTIAEIAYEWGFTSPASFSQLYKNYFGRTPTEARAYYREQALQREQSHRQFIVKSNH